MARIFLSHSSFDNSQALAFRDWLAEHGWDDVFLDIDPERGLSAGERWQEALRTAAGRCEAVICLISNAWLESRWCLAEFLLAKQLGKRIFPVLLEAVELDRLPGEMSDTWQIVDLAGDEQAYQRIREGLSRAGLDADSFDFPDGRRPYPGLEPLAEDDAAIFFGRETQLIRALDRLRSMRDTGVDRFLLILGASGAGKSSFLRAGLWPRLERDYRAFLPLPVVRPERGVINGSYGLVAAFEKLLNDDKATWVDNSALPRTRSEIRTFLAQPDGLAKLAESICRRVHETGVNPQGHPPALVLSVDQFEELFGEDGGEEAEKFSNMLLDALAASRWLVIVAAMRSDAYPRFQDDAVLSQMSHEPFGLAPIAPVHFRKIIEGPAQLARPKLDLDPQLVSALLRGAGDSENVDAGHAIGGADVLPLLAFTLERLYREHGRGGELLLEHYIAMGGISGALRSAIDEAIATGQANGRLPRDEAETQALMRAAFIPHLVTAAESGSFVRRIARLDEIPEASHPVIDVLVENRLLIKDHRRVGDVESDVVEIAHEAILREWPLLKSWLEESGAFLKWRSATAGDLDKWLGASDLGKEDYMLTGPQLSEGEYWLKRRAQDFSADSRAFVKESISRSYGRDVDRARGAARMTNLTFLAFMVVCLLVLFGAGSITQTDLLLARPVTVPIVNSQMDLFQFLGLLPIVLVVFHAWVLSQHAVLVSRLNALDGLMTERERGQYTHLDTRRFDVDTYLFAQSLAGPPFGSGLRFTVQYLVLGALFLLPLFILAFVQLVALPLHDTTVTWANRIGIVADAILVIYFASWLLRLGPGRPEKKKWWRFSSGEILAYVIAPIAVLFSFLVATIPDEQLDRFARGSIGDLAQAGGGPLFGIFRRNIVVTDADLVIDRDVAAGERTINLRGRDLRYARLDRSDLKQADFTGADLSNASLVATDLRGARLACADSTELILTADRRRANCVRANGANFSRADLSQSVLQGMQARGAKFEEANLEGADLSFGLLSQTDFALARLSKADLTGGADLSGASFRISTLHGANLSNAIMLGADFSSAEMQGAILRYALLGGAVLEGATLDGASLNRVKVFGADFSQASIKGTDFSGAQIWGGTQPLKEAGTGSFASFDGTRLDRPTGAERERLTETISQIESNRIRQAALSALNPVLDDAASQSWAGSKNFAAWERLIADGQGKGASEGDSKQDVSSYLADIACQNRYLDGGVARGVAAQALAPDSRLDATVIFERLNNANCAPSQNVPRRLLLDLQSRANAKPGATLPKVSAGTGSSFCEGYASSSIEQQRKNVTLNCGFIGPSWTRSDSQHLTWCRSATPEQARLILQQRAKELDACETR